MRIGSSPVKLIFFLIRTPEKASLIWSILLKSAGKNEEREEVQYSRAVINHQERSSEKTMLEVDILIRGGAKKISYIRQIGHISGASGLSMKWLPHKSLLIPVTHKVPYDCVRCLAERAINCAPHSI